MTRGSVAAKVAANKEQHPGSVLSCASLLVANWKRGLLPTASAEGDEMKLETWYEIQYSLIGADDWYSSGKTLESERSARVHLSEMWHSNEHEYRIAKKTVTEEVMA